jgi:hypothetical protein
MITNKSKIPQKEDCPVCDERLLLEPVRIIPRTQCLVHSDCLWLHLQQKNTCPKTGTVLEKDQLKKDCTTLGLGKPTIIKSPQNTTNESSKLITKSRVLPSGPKILRRKRKQMTLAVGGGRINHDNLVDPKVNKNKLDLINRKYKSVMKQEMDKNKRSNQNTMHSLNEIGRGGGNSPIKNKLNSSIDNSSPNGLSKMNSFAGRNAQKRFTRR